MASTFSTNLALELIGTGDQAGSWGNTTNTNLGTLIEQAISGYVTQGVTTGNTTSITIPDGATGVARNMFIELTGTGGTNTVLAVPANKKLYFIYNNTSGAVTVKVGAGTGVSVAATEKKILVSNGTDIVEATSYLTAVGGSLTLTTLTATSATITNLTSTSLTLSNNPTLSGGTANGVLYLNGSKVATSGSALTFDGTNLGIGTASPFTTLDVNGYFTAGVRNTTNISLTSGTHYFGSSPSDLLRNNIVGNINTDSTTPVRLRFYKSRGTSASPTAVSSGDQTNDIQTYAYDGSSFIQATSIQAVVTATPSTNNVSSALSFSTNGGSSSPTERMRISSDGSVGIGGTANANAKAEVLGTLPSSSGASRGVIVSGTFPSGATASANAFTSFPSTEAASFTASILRHFFASQGTIGAGSAVTSQFGFAVNSNLTGATNNYGFYSDIASGSNRWNFYAAGTANNYFAGSVGIGTTSIGVPLDVGAGSGSVSIRINGASSGNGNGANIYFSNASVVVGTLGNPSVLSGGAFDNSIALTGYYGLRFDTTGTERMRITSTGNVVAGGSVALATTATDGFLYVPTCAGTPTGTPTAITGMAPIVVNTTNNKLYFYSGGAWRDAGP
jgi:hypothetical protein